MSSCRLYPFHLISLLNALIPKIHMHYRTSILAQILERRRVYDDRFLSLDPLGSDILLLIYNLWFCEFRLQRWEVRPRWYILGSNFPSLVGACAARELRFGDFDEVCGRGVKRVVWVGNKVAGG